MPVAVILLTHHQHSVGYGILMLTSLLFLAYSLLISFVNSKDS